MNENDSHHDTSSKDKKHQSDITTPLISSDCNIQYSNAANGEDDEPLLQTLKEESKCMKFYGVLSTLTIEPIMFCFMFAFLMNLTCFSNMVMDKGCLFYFNYSSEVCKQIKNETAYPNEKTNVEMLATDYTLYSSLMSLIGAFFMIFIAPWSDKYGRKLPLTVAIFGVILTDCGLILCTVYFDSRLEYLILSRIPSEVAGGFICVLTIIYSHASEVSSDKTRTLKYTFVEAALGLGIAFGGLTAGFLFRYYGYFYVYVTVAALHVFCFLWALFVVEETRGLDSTAKWSDKAKDFFICQSFKKGIAATFRKRERNNRAIVLLLIISMCIIVLNYESLGSIGFIYVHHIYSWDPTSYSIVITTSMLIQLSLTLTLVPLLINVCKTSDYVIGLIGGISMMLKSFIIAFAKYHQYLYYIGLATGMFTSLSTLAVRTGMSKLVDRDELGRVFSFLATCEAIIPTLGNVATAEIFKTTINMFPNLSYTVSAVLLILPLGTFLWAHENTRKSYNSLGSQQMTI